SVPCFPIHPSTGHYIGRALEVDGGAPTGTCLWTKKVTGFLVEEVIPFGPFPCRGIDRTAEKLAPRNPGIAFFPCQCERCAPAGIGFGPVEFTARPIQVHIAGIAQGFSRSTIAK